LYNAALQERRDAYRMCGVSVSYQMQADQLPAIKRLREGDQWYAVFSCEYEFDPTLSFHPSEEAVGVDLGVKCFAVLSTGEAIENPRLYRKSRGAGQSGPSQGRAPQATQPSPGTSQTGAVTIVSQGAQSQAGFSPQVGTPTRPALPSAGI
jgi:hypothetical protein